MFPKIVVPPKSSILIGFSIIFTIHVGVPLFLEIPISWEFSYDFILRAILEDFYRLLLDPATDSQAINRQGEFTGGANLLVAKIHHLFVYSENHQGLLPWWGMACWIFPTEKKANDVPKWLGCFFVFEEICVSRKAGSFWDINGSLVAGKRWRNWNLRCHEVVSLHRQCSPLASFAATKNSCW